MRSPMKQSQKYKMKFLPQSSNFLQNSIFNQFKFNFILKQSFAYHGILAFILLFPSPIFDDYVFLWFLLLLLLTSPLTEVGNINMKQSFQSHGVHSQMFIQPWLLFLFLFYHIYSTLHLNIQSQVAHVVGSCVVIRFYYMLSSMF